MSRMGPATAECCAVHGLNSYHLFFSLFRGSFARVKLAIRRSDSHPFAVKIIRKKHLSQEAMKVVYDEITILQKVRGFASVHVFAL